MIGAFVTVTPADTGAAQPLCRSADGEQAVAFAADLLVPFTMASVVALQLPVETRH